MLEVCQVLSGDEAVDMRQGRAHAGGEGLVFGVALERVDPDDRVARTREPGHLAGDQTGIVELPAVRDDHEDRFAGKRSPSPGSVERRERCADASASGPVLYVTRDGGECVVGV